MSAWPPDLSTNGWVPPGLENSVCTQFAGPPGSARVGRRGVALPEDDVVGDGAGVRRTAVGAVPLSSLTPGVSAAPPGNGVAGLWK